MAKRTKAQVLALVRNQLKRAELGDIRFDVVPDEIWRRNGHWYLSVLPSARPPSAFQYYEVLGDVETELSEKHHLDVWLVPEWPEN
jgi:hypothetical protein